MAVVSLAILTVSSGRSSTFKSEKSIVSVRGRVLFILSRASFEMCDYELLHPQYNRSELHHVKNTSSPCFHSVTSL